VRLLQRDHPLRDVERVQQQADDLFGEETYYAKVDTSLPERAPRRWERKPELVGAAE